MWAGNKEGGGETTMNDMNRYEIGVSHLLVYDAQKEILLKWQK